MLDFNQLVHRVISRRHPAVGQLADFQGANDEHIWIDTYGVSNAENQPTGHGPKGRIEKGPSASLFVRQVSHRNAPQSRLASRPFLKPTVCRICSASWK